MPTISQLPPANAVSATDEVPISQAGTDALCVGRRAFGVGTTRDYRRTLLSLLGRTSLGSGSPEQVDLGLGLSLSNGTLIADGLDHCGFCTWYPVYRSDRIW